jgi:hypothetical protein
MYEVLCNNTKFHDSYSIDHICRIKHCINPEHLRWASASEQTKNQNKFIKNKAKSSPPNHNNLQERVIWYLDNSIITDFNCKIANLSINNSRQKINWKSKSYTIHILFYLLERDGHITEENYENFTKNNFVRHTCATKINHCCCNPEHLEELPKNKEGRKLNAIDALLYSKSVKITYEDRKEIKELYLDNYFDNWSQIEIYKHIASIYSVSHITINNIINSRV